MTFGSAIRLDEGPSDRAVDGLDGTVLDMALAPDGVTTTALLDDGRLVTIRNLDGAVSETTTIPGATNIVIDDQLRTAAIDGDGRITILDQHHNPITTVDVPGATGIQFSQRSAAFLTYDGPHQELVAIPGNPVIPGDPVEPRRLPLAPDGPPIAPDATLSVNPTSGIVGLLEPGTSQLTRVTMSEGHITSTEPVALGDGAPLEGLVADATGAWYSTRAGEIVAFDIDGTELVDNPFAGQPAAPNFQMFQPMNIGTAPEGPNVLPQEVLPAGDQLTLSHASATATVGEAHEVTATLTDETGSPLADRAIAYATTGASAETGTAHTDASGQATISWTAPAAGNDVLTVWEDLNGDGRHDPEEPAAALEVTWTEATGIATQVALASSANPSRPRQRVNLTATVTAADGSTPQGTVQFTDDGTALGGPAPLDDEGTATVSTRSLTPGTHRIEATFAPAEGSGYTASTATLDQLVGRYQRTGNLIRNPGADDAAGSPTGDVVAVPDWPPVAGQFTAVEYGSVDPATELPFPTSEEGPPNGGPNFFAGGPASESGVTVQIIPLPADTLAAVDAGTATYLFSAWIGGWREQNDLCEPVLLFTEGADGTGNTIGRNFLIGGQAADRGGVTGFLPYETTGSVPPGARSAHVALEFSRVDGVYNDGYCDSLGLQLAIPNQSTDR